MDWKQGIQEVNSNKELLPKKYSKTKTPTKARSRYTQNLRKLGPKKEPKTREDLKTVIQKRKFMMPPQAPKYQSGTNPVPIWCRHISSLPTLFLARSRGATLTAEQSWAPNQAEWEQGYIFKRTPNSAWWKSDRAACASRDECPVNCLFQ